MEKECINIGDDGTSKKLLKTTGDALYVIGRKWKLRIIIALFNDKKRFNDLKRSLDSISARALSNELKEPACLHLRLLKFIALAIRGRLYRWRKIG